MKTPLFVVLLACLQGCAPDSAALKERRDDGSTLQYQENRHDIEQRLGQSVGLVPRSDGGVMELYLKPACGRGCVGVNRVCAAHALNHAGCAVARAGQRGDCGWRRVYVHYDQADRVLSVLVERLQKQAPSACTTGRMSVSGSLS